VLNRTSPRSAILGFLEACHSENYDKATHYLDLRALPQEERAAEGVQLSQQLGQILDRDSQFEVGSLSNEPEGNRFDGEAPDKEILEKFQTNEQNLVLYLQRVTFKSGAQVWLVSEDSLRLIPELAALIGESPIEKRLPAPFVTIKLLGTSLWVWIALVLLALILSFLSKLLSQLVLFVLRPVLRRYAKTVHSHRLEEFVEPLRLLLAVVVFRACMEFVAPSALLRLYITRVLALLFFLAAASIAMRIVNVISDRIIARLDVRQRAISLSVLSLTVRCIKICLFAIAVLLILASWGYNTNAILAGLGVGGIAIALASQKTIENLFGGVSVILDKPVLVGDFCNFGGQVGTVEDIGLRSTRIRTLDRTVVTIPNATFSTMTLENYSKRDRMWFHPTLSLRRGTGPDEIRQAVDAVTKVLKNNPLVDPTDVPVRFTKITAQSFDLELFSYILTADGNVFVKTQTELLLNIIDALAKLGILFAVPMQEAVVTAHRGQDASKLFRIVGNVDEMDGANSNNGASGIPSASEVKS
jgi:MscS family membrane protein